jgi:general secretion pathway protein M
MAAININNREKQAIALAVVGIVIFLVVQFIISPQIDKRKRLRQSITTQRQALEEITLLKAEYESISRQAERSKAKLARREKGFTLFSFLDKLAGDTGIKNNIAYMKPSTSSRRNMPYQLSMVELKIEEINLQQLVDFLYRVETSKNMVSIKRLSITKDEKKEGLINSILEVETFEI